MKFIKENFWSIIGVSFLVLLVAAVQMKWLQSSLPTGDSVYVPFTIGFAALDFGYKVRRACWRIKRIDWGLDRELPIALGQPVWFTNDTCTCRTNPHNRK